MGRKEEKKSVTWEIRALFLLVAWLDAGAIKSAYWWHRANYPWPTTFINANELLLFRMSSPSMPPYSCSPSLHHRQHDGSDDIWYFLPIQVCKSTPEPPELSSHPKYPAARNIPNGALLHPANLDLLTLDWEKKASETKIFSVKRHSESFHTTHRPLKRQRLFDDMDWLKHDVDDIKDHMTQITDHMRLEVDSKLDEILYEVRQSNAGMWWSVPFFFILI